MSERNVYTYKGPVKHYDQVIANNWDAETTAASEKQARNNLMFQFRKKYGYTTSFQITLTGKINKEDTEE